MFDMVLSFWEIVTLQRDNYRMIWSILSPNKENSIEVHVNRHKNLRKPKKKTVSINFCAAHCLSDTSTSHFQTFIASYTCTQLQNLKGSAKSIGRLLSIAPHISCLRIDEFTSIFSL